MDWPDLVQGVQATGECRTAEPSRIGTIECQSQMRDPIPFYHHKTYPSTEKLQLMR